MLKKNRRVGAQQKVQIGRCAKQRLGSDQPAV